MTARVPSILSIAASLFGVFASQSLAAGPEISVATWSGVYGSAQEAAVFKPFTRETGIGVRIVHYDGDLGGLEAGGGPAWSVVDLERSDLEKLCVAGTVMQIDLGALLGRQAAEDFIAGTAHPCGIASLIWSQAIAYDALAAKKQKPTTLGDFFDLIRFPGKRGLSVSAVGTVEMALLADGIPPEDVYDVLRRPGGMDRALAKLDTLGGAVAFWQDGDGPANLIDDGTVSMSTAYAGRFLRPREGARRPVGILLDHHLWRATYWAIPKSSPDAATSHRFVAFATDPSRLADLSTRLWFGPARKSGIAAVPPNVREDLPTARRHFRGALQIDASYWREFGDDVEAAYAAWRGRRPG